MKQSFYNKVYVIDDKKFLFNTLNRGLIEINSRISSILNNNELEKLSEEEIKVLKTEMMIIEENVNELEEIETVYYNKKREKTLLSYVITPTLNCNLRCTYCYQEHLNKMMTEIKAKAVIEHITRDIKQNQPKKLLITWFGGEPLLNPLIIEKISQNLIEYCKQNKIQYNANIITNGYLINENVVNVMKRCLIEEAQITIDGPKEIHDNRRMQVNGKGTFDRIIKGIELFAENDISVYIRVNIDKINSKYLEKMLIELKPINNNKISIGLGHVQDYTEVCKDVQPVMLTDKEYRENELQFYKLLKKHGFEYKHLIKLPEQIVNCGAVLDYCDVIDSNGYIYKCWNDVGVTENSYNTINSHNEELLYTKFNPFEIEKCVNCKGLPLCLGGCPYNFMKNNEPQCVDYDEIVKNYIKAINEI